MMAGESRRTYPTVEIPTWSASEDFTPAMNSPDCSSMLEALAVLQRYLPDPDTDPDGPDSPVDAYSCDHFRMYDFKVRRCARGRSHDWTECPYAHPGEKARRRDPAKYFYSGTACPDFRKGGGCEKGDSCEFAHGVFECWLHPARYRTQPCKDGGNCRRRVCFFAHSPDQLRCLNRSPDRVDSFDVSSPMRRAFQLSASPVSGSPPMSPRADSETHSLGSSSVNDVVASFRNLQLEKVKSFPSSYNNNPLRCYQSGFGSPRGSILGHGFQSLPTTPIRPGNMDIWENGLEEEPVVESGRELRAKMFEKLSKENCMERVEPDPDQSSDEAPDVGWVTELVM